MTATGMPGPDDVVEFVDARNAFEKLRAVVALFAHVPAPPDKRVLRFRFTVFEPDPGWPPNLHAFPVPTFQDGSPVPPDGTEGNPITIAVNGRLGDDDQALAVSVAQYVVATMRRQSAVAEVVADRAPLASLSEGVDALDRVSQSEAIAMARAVRAGRGDEVRIASAQLGYGVRADVIPSWLPDGPTFRSRVPFYARCYNELPIVRETVDRIVSATIGVGPRVSAASEEVRRLAERWSADAKLTLNSAHAMRDAVLLGVGCLAVDLGRGEPGLRLVRPDRLDLGSGPSSEIRENQDGTWVNLEHPSVLRWTPQPNSRYGASLLDPYVLTLFSVVEIRATAQEMERRLAASSVSAAVAQHVAETVATSRTMADTAEATLATFSRPITELFPAPRYPMYLRGHERWP
jgi:hypothetical protein